MHQDTSLTAAPTPALLKVRNTKETLRICHLLTPIQQSSATIAKDWAMYRPTAQLFG